MRAGWHCFQVSTDSITLLEEKGILTKIIMSWQGPSVTCGRGKKQECLTKIILRDLTRSSDVLVSINANLWFQKFLAFQPKDKRKKMHTKSVKRGKD
jgi:hypothetical protein